MKVVFIFHYGRCGSTVISEILHKFPNALHFNEYLSTTSDFTKFPCSDKSLSREDGAQNSPQAIACALRDDIKALSRTRQAPPDFVFFELKSTDFRRGTIRSELETFLNEFNNELPLSSVVHLYRLNLLRLSLSHIQGHRTGIWHSINKVKPSPHHLDIFRLRQDMAGFATEILEAKKAIEHYPYTNICYERHIYSDPFSSLYEIFSALGDVPLAIARREYPVSLKKTNDFPLKDIIENFDELERFVAVHCLTPLIIADDQRSILETGIPDMQLLANIRASLLGSY